MGRIVVGVDGSPPARAALDWAIAEAKLRSSKLDVVVSWNHPVMASAEPIIVPMPDAEILAQSAKTTAEEMANHCGLINSGLDYEIFTPEGRPGEELVNCAKGADLLVVGSYGSSALKELIVGSVSNYCAHHSTCPVVLVRHPESAER